MYSVAPPKEVQARPVATPIGVSSYKRSLEKTALPR